MTQPTPGPHDALAALFARRGLDGADFFGHPGPPIDRLIAAGDDALEADDLQVAEEAYADALHLATVGQLPVLGASVRNRLSRLMDAKGNLPEALNYLEDALAIYTQLADKRGVAVTLGNIGGIKASMGQFDTAMSLLKQSLASAEELGDDRLSLGILLNIGRNYNEAGFWANAVPFFQESGDKALKIESFDIALTCLLNEGNALLHLGRAAEGGARLQQALEMAERLEIHTARAMVLDSLGLYHELLGARHRALEHYQQAHQLAQKIDYAEGQLNAALNLGRVNVDHGDLVLAAEQLHEALRLATQLDRPANRRDAHQQLSLLYKRRGQPALALQHFEQFHAEERALLNTERDKTTRTLMMQFDVERAQTQTRAEREQREHAQTLQAQAEAQVRERTAELEQTQMEVVTRLAMAAEFRDDATGEHTRRVGIGAALIAEALGLTPGFVDTLRVAARLHDVGKIGIPDAVLLKAGKLSVSEFEEMKRHTLIGARLLSGGQSEVLNMARQIALTHHERWDGSGYPNGLSGTEIPLVGRIVALADVFDALTHKRPYKSAWHQAETLSELARQRGRHFDPELLDAALLVFGGGRYEAALQEGAREPAAYPASDPPRREAETLKRHQGYLPGQRARELEAAHAQAMDYQTGGQLDLLRRAALTDAPTGLHNRRAFGADVLLLSEQAAGPAGRSQPSLCVFSLQLEGHPGDDLLGRAAQQVQQHFGPGARIYRTGSDTLAALLWSGPGVPRGEPDRDLAALEAALGAGLRRQGHLAPCCTGHAHWPQDVSSPAELLALSEERLHRQRSQRRQPLPKATFHKLSN